jgi:hypothetical protein
MRFVQSFSLPVGEGLATFIASEPKYFCLHVCCNLTPSPGGAIAARNDVYGSVCWIASDFVLAMTGAAQ